MRSATFLVRSWRTEPWQSTNSSCAVAVGGRREARRRAIAAPQRRRASGLVVLRVVLRKGVVIVVGCVRGLHRFDSLECGFIILYEKTFSKDWPTIQEESSFFLVFCGRGFLWEG